jgi:hypothetical protein
VVLSQLAAWFTAALQMTETKRKLVVQALFPTGVCTTDFSNYLRKKYEDYGRAIRKSHIKAE